MVREFFNEKYHDNCHDYLKDGYIMRYAMEEYKQFLIKLKKLIPKINICDEHSDYDKTIVCDQHAVIFTNSKDRYPIVATFALNACVGLLMFCPNFGVAALAHIDGLPGYSKKSANLDGVDISFDPVEENIRMILSIIKKMTKTSAVLDIEYYLIGGIFNLSEIMIYDIIECLEKIGNEYSFIFKGRNLLGPENQSRNICFSTITGKISHFDYIDNSQLVGRSNIIKAPRKLESILDITYRSVLL